MFFPKKIPFGERAGTAQPAAQFYPSLEEFRLLLEIERGCLLTFEDGRVPIYHGNGPQAVQKGLGLRTSLQNSGSSAGFPVPLDLLWRSDRFLGGGILRPG